MHGADSIMVGGVYDSEQSGFAWRFTVLGLGPKRIRARQESTAGGFRPRLRLLTIEQWRAYHPTPRRDGIVP